VLHGPEVLGKHGGEKTVLFRQAAVADYVAGVLDGRGFLDLFLEFDPAVPDVIVEEFDGVYNFLFRRVA